MRSRDFRFVLPTGIVDIPDKSEGISRSRSTAKNSALIRETVVPYETRQTNDPKYREICSSETLQSSKNGFFYGFASGVCEKVGSDWIHGIFAAEKSEEDKVKLCCKDKRVWGIIQETLKNVKPVFREKSASASREKRMKGEEFLKENDFHKAALTFSQSIIRAPALNRDRSVDDGFSLPLAYECRARAYYNLQMYNECLTDLHLALKEGIPGDIKYKIYKLMAHCHQELRNKKKAGVCFRLAIKMLEDKLLETVNHRPKDKENMEWKEREEIKRCLSNLDKREIIEPPLVFSGNLSLPEVTGGVNEKYPSASKEITVLRSGGAGRFAVAAENIATGDTLVVEAPYASCLIPDMFSSHCHHCYSRLKTPMPCNNCSGLAFCSMGCRDTALSTYHKYECPYLGLFIGAGISVLSFLALRMVTQEKITFFKQLQNKIRFLTAENQTDFKFTEKEMNYINIYRLVTHSDMRLSEDYFKRTLMAIFLVKCLKKTDFFGDENSRRKEELSEEEILTASLILHHLQLLQFNAHEIYETRIIKPGRVKGSKSVYIAVGIYPTVALFNHECSPSVTRYFHGKNIIIKAVKPIQKGEIVSENYGPIFAKRTLPERIRELSSRYWFKCECDACLEDWPKIEYLTKEHFRFRCPTYGCSGLLKWTKNAEKKERKLRCRKCFNNVNLEDATEKIESAQDLFDKGIQEMENDNSEEAIPLLISYLEDIFHLGVPPSREIFLCQEALRSCYAQSGNVWSCNQDSF